MGLDEGVYVSDSVETIVDSMMADAKEYFDTDLNDSEESIIRTFYLPIAIQLRNIQDDVGLVLESTQIDNAEGDALDLLTALIGVKRKEATFAEGTVTFSRDEPSDSVNYTIPSGSVVQTQGITSVKFETSETSVLEIGETEVDVDVEALEPGPDSNVGANTVTSTVNGLTGIDSVTNKSTISGGSIEESDDELRERAKNELAKGSRATAGAIFRAINSIEGTEAVKIFPAYEYNLGENPGFEVVAHGGSDFEIAQTLLDVKAAGDYTYSGNFGDGIDVEVELPNGQTQSESFSRPQNVTIYVEANIETTDEYAGEEAVLDSIVNYIGGMNTSGNTISGDVNVGDDVLYGEVEYAIRDIPGVFDVKSLYIGTSSSPNGQSNISIEEFEVATTNAMEEIVITEV